MQRDISGDYDQIDIEADQLRDRRAEEEMEGDVMTKATKAEAVNKSDREFTDTERLDWLVRVHFRLASRPNYWYDKLLQGVDSMICVEASNLRAEMRREEESK